MYLLIKHFFDFSTAIVSFIFLYSLFIIVTLFLFIINDGKPFIFRQRPGKDKRVFRILKFKTMNDKKDDTGRFVLSTSIDGLPQLLNMIKGEMNMIRPRPFPTQYLELYNNFQKRRHLVKPGITGWALVNGGNAISWNNKFKLDVYYVENVTFH